MLLHLPYSMHILFLYFGIDPQTSQFQWETTHWLQSYFESGGGGGGLTSDSKWVAENTFSQYLFIIFKKVCVGGWVGAEAPPAPPPLRALETHGFRCHLAVSWLNL